jgi:hypothetical protein
MQAAERSSAQRRFRLEDSCLVGEHDRLHAVAEVELLEDVA